jgi:phage terminase large subunit-like protein
VSCDFFENVLGGTARARTPGSRLSCCRGSTHVLRELFGRLSPDGTRQHRVGYIELPKKQGKSTTAGRHRPVYDGL